MDTRDKIILYSSERFFKEGFSNVTMDEIALGLRISKKTVYKHFFSKRDLVHTIINEFISEFQKELTISLSGNADAVSKLNAYSLVIIGKLTTINEKWLSDIQTKEPKIFNEIENFRENFINKNLRETILQGIKEGLIKDSPPNLIIHIILSIIREIINPEFLLKNNISPKDAIENVLDLFFGGILTKKGRKNYKNIKAYK